MTHLSWHIFTWTIDIPDLQKNYLSAFMLTAIYPLSPPFIVTYHKTCTYHLTHVYMIHLVSSPGECRDHRELALFTDTSYLACMHIFLLKEIHCKTDSTKSIICHQCVTSTAHLCPTLIPTRTLHGAKTTDIALTQSPRQDHKSIIIPINLLYLQTWVKKIGKSILPCLEVHLGDVSPFQPCGRTSRGCTAPLVAQNFPNTRAVVQPGRNCKAVKWVYGCQTASVQLAQLINNATRERNCSRRRAEYFCFTAKQATC